MKGSTLSVCSAHPHQDVLQKRPATPTLKHYVVGYMRDSTQSFDYTLSVLADLERQALAEIERLGGNVKLVKILSALRVRGLDNHNEPDPELEH
jgi:geranylgeranyl diphosphate synthase type 3